MIINNSHFVLRAIFPSENYPPLLVDSNAPEPGLLPLQLFKSIAWGNLKILNDSRLIDHAQLAPGPLLDIPRQASDPQATVDALRR
jgi:hypothetical protein